MGFYRACALVGASVAAAVCCTAQSAPQPRGIDWHTASTVPAALAPIFEQAASDAHHDLKGIVIVRHGHLVSEAYFNGDNAATLHDIRSATKSITSLAMGLAIANGKVKSTAEPIAMYLPGLPADKAAVRIDDLLTMRSGLDADDDDPKSPGDEDNLDASSDWIKTAYTVPLKRTPGSTYLYCSLNAFLTGAIVENATRMPLDTFVAKNLFTPLGIGLYEWRHVPVNRTTGQGNLSITARDAAAIGQMMLQNGRVNGRQVVPVAWVTRSLASTVDIHTADPFADSYGYMWYTRDEPVGGGTVCVHFASGNGGNKIYMIPSRDMVVVVTSSAYNTRWGQRRSQDILLKVLAALP